MPLKTRAELLTDIGQSLPGSTTNFISLEPKLKDRLTDIVDSIQVYDADLEALAALTPADNSFIVGNGTTWTGESGATARTSLGLGSMATESASSYKTINTDQGFTFSLTAATQPIEHEPFGGLFNSAAASNVAHLQIAGTHTGPRFAQAFTAETAGGNPNGPGSSVFSLWLHSQKENYLTSTATGEVDGLYIVANQGINGDVGGGLVDISKVDGGTGGITCFETLASRIDGAGAKIRSNDSVVNYLPGAGELSAAGGHGFYSEARVGTVYSAFTAAAGNDFGANLTNFFVGTLSRNASDIRFRVGTDGTITSVSTAAGNMLTLSCTDGGAAAGSGILLDRVSGSPANGDNLSQILFRGRDDAAVQTLYASIVAIAQDVTAAGKTGRVQVSTSSAGTSAERLRVGVGIYHPLATGGDTGNNTINFGEYYVHGSRVLSTRKTGWATATGTATRTTFATSSVTLPQLAERVKALIDDLHNTAGHGLIGT